MDFFLVFNVSTLVAWNEEKDVTDHLSGQCPHTSGFVKDTFASGRSKWSPKKLNQRVQTVSDADKIVWKYQFVRLGVIFWRMLEVVAVQKR